MKTTRSNISIFLGRSLDYLPFLLLAAVMAGVVFGKTKGLWAVGILLGSLAVALAAAGLDLYRR